ncbi:hypothetical protein PR002_g31466 [Phytophthora rubi]|uniref:ZSWIM1/3 RNaseH-like domain-containing protein n=1 Tax=Phytophthora rubi TaxID=129364 RepID=A0A6A3GHT5_9STRA|nr:hypothetical protein PR002_g31466 [Phytophthora rubi]
MGYTHRSTQASRGEGRRDKDSRYTGYEAGYLVRSEEVISDGQAEWQVCVVPGTEISTHNHKTNKIIYDSYRVAKSMPLPPQFRKELGLLKQVNTSTADINRYLSNKLDMLLSPQQTRNILQHVLGSSILERTKTLLDGFADEDVGNDVLLVQDQIGISCAIAIQTWIQKQWFLEWGDSIVMDWTHGTNNLGYHLEHAMSLGNRVPVTIDLTPDGVVHTTLVGSG